MGYLSNFHKNLIKLRKEKKLSVSDLARKLSIPIPTYRHYEDRSFPPIEIIVKIVKELNITYNDLFEPFLDRPKREIQDIIRRVCILYENNQTKKYLLDNILLIENMLIKKPRKELPRIEEGKARGSPNSG